MNRKLLIIAALMLAAVISGGTFAATFTQSYSTIGVTAATGNIATVTTAPVPPYWDYILPPPDYERMRPDASGDKTGITTQYPPSGSHWEKVAEPSIDGDGTYVETSNVDWQEDLYSLANHIAGGGRIFYVKLYFAARTTGASGQTAAYPLIKTNGTEYEGSQVMLGPLYTYYTYQWDTNPYTGLNWTWAEVDALQVGVGLRRPAAGAYARVTQVYVEIMYRDIPISGNVPTGELFYITPQADYPGDLAVKVYLLNVNNLAKAYHVLNLNLYLDGSAEAAQMPNYRTLTLDNGVATLNLPGGVGVSHTLSIVSGTYTLVSIDPTEWVPGWTIVPELYAEVAQR